jgi:hypothetical protein
MVDPFAEAEHQTELLLEAAQRLRNSLRMSETIYRRTLKGLQRGSDVTATIRAEGAGAARQGLTAAFKEFESQRHQTRLAIIAAQLAEGESIGEIGRSWEFSRQLASTYAREAKERYGGGQ